jgi:hypothetical protein
MNEMNLGEPLDIRALSVMLGCSAWTVRHKLVPAGLPVFRFSPSGKLTFFRDQVVAWVLERQKQQKGGIQR